MVSGKLKKVHTKKPKRQITEDFQDDKIILFSDIGNRRQQA
jgi:hypothetical protein